MVLLIGAADQPKMPFQRREKIVRDPGWGSSFENLFEVIWGKVAYQDVRLPSERHCDPHLAGVDQPLVATVVELDGVALVEAIRIGSALDLE